MRFFSALGYILPLTIASTGVTTLPTKTASAQTVSVPKASDDLPGWNLDLNNAAQPLYVRGEQAFVVGQPPSIGTPDPSLSLWNHRNEKLADLVAGMPSVDGTVKWQLPTDRTGYFEIRPNGSDFSWPALGSRPANRLTYAVVDKVRDNASHDYKYHFLSIQGSSGAGSRNSTPSPNVYRYLGIQAQAVDYGWYKIEPKPGDPNAYADFFAHDTAPRNTRAAKTWPYFYISRIPIWAIDRARLAENERNKTATSSLPPQDLKQYEAYLERVVPYIAKTYAYLPYRVYEVEWEPVIPWGWHGTPEEIVAMFEVAHRVVQKYDRGGRVSGPTLSSFGDIPLYETLLKGGLGKYIDVSGWHMYSAYPPEEAGIPAALNRVRALNKQYTGHDLPLFGTEFGLPEAKAGGTENQAYGMTAAALLFRAEGVDQHTLFYLTDYASEPGYGLFYNDVNGTPYAPDKISPKPAIPMLRAAIDQIGEAHGFGRLDYLGPNIWGYVYQDEENGQMITALWDETGRDRTLVFDTGAEHVQVVDCFGNREERTTDNGKVSLQLRRSPVYVRGISAAIFGPSQKKPLLLSDHVWKVFRGQKLRQTFALSQNLNDKTTMLSVELPAEIASPLVPAKIKTTAGSKAHVDLQIAPDAPLGLFAGSVRLKDHAGTPYHGIQRVEVVPELQIGEGKLQNAGKSWSLQSLVRNVSPAAWSGQVTLTLNGETQTRPLSVLPRQETSLRFDIAPPADVSRKTAANLELRSTTGSSLSRVTDLSFFSIQKADANDIWGKMRLMPLRATDGTIFRTFAQAKFGGDEDLSAQAGYAYDAANLYVQYLVEDDVHRNSASPTQMWKQDSIQMAFDMAPGRESNSNQVAEAFERSNSEWGFAFTDRGPEIYVWIPPGGSALAANSVVAIAAEPGAGTGYSIRLEGGTNGAMTTYRVTIPWKIIDPRGLHRDALGVAAAINDSDADPGYLDRRAILLFSGIIGPKNPNDYGRALLQ